MKKSLFCMLLLTVLSCASIGWIHNKVDTACDQVELTSIVELGNLTAAEQLELHFVNSMDDRMFWDTTFIPGQPAETNFTYLHKPYEYRPENSEYYLFFQLPFNTARRFGSSDHFEVKDEGPMTSLFNEVVAHTKPGTIHTEVLNTRDYFPELPMELLFSSPSNDYDLSLLKWQLEDEYLTDAQRAPLQQRLDFLREFEAFFRFPTPADHYLTIEVCRAEDGSLVSYSCSEGLLAEPGQDRPFPSEEDPYDNYTTSSDWIHDSTLCAQTDDSLFFIPALFWKNDELLDYSLTPGYGVYRLDLTQDPLHMDGLSLVLPLAPEQRVNTLLTDGTGTRLLLATSTDDQATLHILDATSGSLLQSFPLGTFGEITTEEGEETYLSYSYFIDGPLLMVVDSFGAFQFYMQQEDGSYQFTFDGAFPDNDRFFLSGLRSGLLFDYQLAFDGSTLAYAAQTRTRVSRRDQDVDVYELPILLWDKNGLIYGGIYQTSLESSPPFNYSRRTEPFTPAPLELRFLP